MKKPRKIFDEKVMEAVIFERDGYLVDVILQNFFTKKVLFGASMRKEDLRETIERGIVVLWSKSRKTRWVKGETSGDFLKVIDVILNCEKNSLLIKVIPLGKGVCHTTDRKGRPRNTCFYRILFSENILRREFAVRTKDGVNGE